MHIPKKLGEYKIEGCFFCDKRATSRNNEEIPVCATHKDDSVAHLKCVCDSLLEAKQGKYGTFFICENCGPLNVRKVKEINGL